jgi:hypothetical protein
MIATTAVATRLRVILRYTLRGLWSWLVSDRPANYQPERYYMRGPGPKWREKHGRMRAR